MNFEDQLAMEINFYYKKYPQIPVKRIITRIQYFGGNIKHNLEHYNILKNIALNITFYDINSHPDPNKNILVSQNILNPNYIMISELINNNRIIFAYINFVQIDIDF